MLSREPKAVGLAAAIAAAAAVAFLSFEAPLVGGLLVLVSLALIMRVWTRAGRERDEALKDYAISTLVFPPESKFPQSVFPRR